MESAQLMSRLTELTKCGVVWVLGSFGAVGWSVGKFL